MSFGAVEFWHWWVLAIAFGIAEVFLPGFVLIWLGVAAGTVGIVLLAVPALGWEYQLLLFAVVSVASLLSWRVYQRKNPPASDHPTLNRRGEQLVGRQFTLDEPIVNGAGYARIDDTRWKIVGDDMSAGSRVTVTGVEGTVLKVEQA